VLELSKGAFPRTIMNSTHPAEKISAAYASYFLPAKAL